MVTFANICYGTGKMDGSQVEIIWGGDVNLGRRQHFRAAELGFENVIRIPRLREADLRIFNLECEVALAGEQGSPKGEGGPFYFRARPDMLRLLELAGCDIVTTANNHSGDYGPNAIAEQKMWLDSVGIGSVGSGETQEEAFRPIVRRVGKSRIAVFSVDTTQPLFAASATRPGNAFLPLKDLDAWTKAFVPRIASVRRVVDHVLVAVHWGANGEEAPGAAEVKVGHRLIDAGADAVLGTSAHKLQGIEVYRGRPIIHDAGDLLFDRVSQTLEPSGIFALRLGASGVNSVEFVPVEAGYGYCKQLEGGEAEAATRAYAEKCAKFATILDVTPGGHGFVEVRPDDRPTINPSALPAGSTTEKVPPDAEIEPLRLGPLRLLGVRLNPRRMTERQMLWVESFWDAAEQPDSDYRIGFLAEPVIKGAMPAWGRSMDHDPCDWRVPTSGWSLGTIYRDFYGLRPPPISQMKNVELQLSVTLSGPEGEVARHRLPHLALPILPSKGAPAFSNQAPKYRTTFDEALLRSELPPGATWTAEQVAGITGGRWLVPPPAGWAVRSVVNDAKQIRMRPGPVLFVGYDSYDRSRHEGSSFTDKNVDRHQAIIANRSHLAGAVVARPLPQLGPEFPQLLVEDPIRAHIELGIAARARYRGEVIAVTGTVGKSSTTAMLLHMLGGEGRVLASIGNYNTRVGAPLTVASLAPDYEAAIVEIAQSALWMKRGPVTRLIRPTVSLVTAIGLSQTAKGVKRIEDVAKWKSRIYVGLEGRAVGVVGEHLACFDFVLSEARRHAKTVLTYGPSEKADLRIMQVAPTASGSILHFRTPVGPLEMVLPALGHGMAINAAGALAAVMATDGDLHLAAERMQSYSTDVARLERFDLQIAEGSFEVLDDSWNAEVISMVHALDVLAARPVRPGGRRIAVLGRIVHLGAMARELHEGLAEPVLASSPDLVLTHGDEMLHLRARLPGNFLGPHFSDAAELAAHLLAIARSGDVVLVKGSRRDSDFGKICSHLRRGQTRSDGLES